MRALIFSLVLLVSVSMSAQEARFIRMTRDVTWPDKSVSATGTIERVLAVSDSDYIVLGLRGAQFSLPRANAVLITAEEAAIALLAEREQLDARYTAKVTELLDDIDALEAQIPKQTTSTQRYYARKAARDAKARADAEFAIKAQQANELQRLRQSVDNLRR